MCVFVDRIMPAIRLKVQINNNNNSSGKSSSTSFKFIYVLDFSPTTTIDELIHLLESYIIRQFSMKNLRLVQLLTDDGYLFSNDQICATVLNDNDRIVCCDMQQFVQENYPTLNLNDLWCEIIQHDASDNLEKRIQVGLTNLEKLFVRIYGSSNHYGVYIFNVFELIKIASEKSQQSE